jgi:hypothetical protein
MGPVPDKLLLSENMVVLGIKPRTSGSVARTLIASPTLNDKLKKKTLDVKLEPGDCCGPQNLKFISLGEEYERETSVPDLTLVETVTFSSLTPDNWSTNVVIAEFGVPQHMRKSKAGLCLILLQSSIFLKMSSTINRLCPQEGLHICETAT